MTKKQIIKGFARHHGKTIFWFHCRTGCVFEAIVLMTLENGLSLKPFDIKEVISASKRIEPKRPIKELKDPKYCFVSNDGRNQQTLVKWIKAFDKYEDVYGFDEHVNTLSGGSPSCGHI